MQPRDTGCRGREFRCFIHDRSLSWLRRVGHNKWVDDGEGQIDITIERIVT